MVAGGYVMPVVIDTSSIGDFENFYKLFPQRASKAMSLSINDTARRVLVQQGKQQLTEEVAFPPGYLNNDRLGVTEFAKPDTLRAVVKGRDRPTSLARFATASGRVPRPGRGGWVPVQSIMVHPGRRRQTNRTFLISLRRGDVATGNVGLAIRLRPGETLQGVDRFSPIQLFPNVYLLFGPSVDQAFQGVVADLAPKVIDNWSEEFYRQFERLTDGGQ
jgi:hypothetical protein